MTLTEIERDVRRRKVAAERVRGCIERMAAALATLSVERAHLRALNDVIRAAGDDAAVLDACDKYGEPAVYDLADPAYGGDVEP